MGMSGLSSCPLLVPMSTAFLRLSAVPSLLTPGVPSSFNRNTGSNSTAWLSKVDLVLQCQSLGHHVQRARIRAVGI